MAAPFFLSILGFQASASGADIEILAMLKGVLMATLTLKKLQEITRNGAAARCRVALQPPGAKGRKSSRQRMPVLSTRPRNVGCPVIQTPWTACCSIPFSRRPTEWRRLCSRRLTAGRFKRQE